MPLFDTSRAALAFAFNYSKAGIKAPTMNSILGEQRLPADWMALPTRRDTRALDLSRDERAGQAGLIFVHYARLAPISRLLTMARVVPSSVRCECHRPCCSGWKNHPDWEAAVDAICVYLRDIAIVHQSGKRGLSSQPLLRRAVVENFFDPKRLFSPKREAERCDISEVTVYHHKNIITSWLDTAEKDAWTTLDEALVAAQIVGALA